MPTVFERQPPAPGAVEEALAGAAAVSGVGGLGFLAAGYKTAEAVLADIAATRELTRQPFGMNVFAPSAGPADRDAVTRYADRLRDRAAALGVVLGDPGFDEDHYRQKVQLLVQERWRWSRSPSAAPTSRWCSGCSRSGRRCG